MTEAEELGVCAVCLNDGADEGNVIILCDSCGIAVHQFCYGVSLIPSDGDKWLCARCTVADDSAQCVLCPMPGGALKPVRENAGPKERSRRSWSHVSCAWFMPCVTFADPVSLAPVTGVQRIEKGRWKLSCTLCKQKNVGACIQCADPKCTTAMHVTCAQMAQLYMAMTDEGGDVQLEVYCRKHTPKDRPANFSVCPELAATPQLLSQVMSGSRPLFASNEATGGKRDGKLASKVEFRLLTPVSGVSSKPGVSGVSGELSVRKKTASPKMSASLRSPGSRAESLSAARGGAVASPSQALAQAGEGGKRRATQTHTPQGINGGGKLSQAQRDLLSTAATPVCAEAEEVGTNPFARIAPATCAVCLTEAGNTDAGALLCCDTCRVQVHEHCWGSVSDRGGGWRCDGCKVSKTHHPPPPPAAVQCSLCPTQGGCLKKTQSGDWVHVQCALWIPELRFEEPERLDGISSTAKIPKERRMLICQICKLPNASCDAAPPKKAKNSTSATSRPRTSFSSACVQCSKKGCFAAFHVTCAQLAGYHMVIMSGADEQDEVPPLTPFCPKHRPRFIWKSHYVDCLKFLTVLPQASHRFSLYSHKHPLVRGELGGNHRAHTPMVPLELGDGYTPMISRAALSYTPIVALSYTPIVSRPALPRPNVMCSGTVADGRGVPVAVHCLLLSILWFACLMRSHPVSSGRILSHPVSCFLPPSLPCGTGCMCWVANRLKISCQCR